MRRLTLLHSATVLTCTLVAACAPDDGGVADDASESGTTETDADGTTSPIDPTNDPDPDPTATTATTTNEPEPTTSSTTAEPADDDSSTTGTEPPDAYDGEWCGGTSTGSLAMGPITLSARFARSNGGPRAFTGWVSTSQELQIAIYDVATATWSDPVTLEEGYVGTTVDYTPFGAVDEQGNAIVAYPEADHVVVQHYDGAAETWTRMELSADGLESPEYVGIGMTPTGHAVLGASEFGTGPTLWFFDPTAGAWSEPTSYADASGTAWAQDPVSSDVVLAVRQDSETLLLQHRDATTGTFTTTEAEQPGYPLQPVSIGDDEFVLVSYTGGFQLHGDLHGHHFDGATWGEPELLGSGTSLSPVRLVGSTDGRAVLSWNGGQWDTYARAFDRDAGWTGLLTANPPEPQGYDEATGLRVVLDDDGFTVAWSTTDAMGFRVRTVARRYEDDVWGAPIDLDPTEPNLSSDIEALDSLGPNRARAVWRRYLSRGGWAYVYACHTPASGWSAATLVEDYLRRVSASPGGDVLVETIDVAGNGYAEYFAVD